VSIFPLALAFGVGFWAVIAGVLLLVVVLALGFAVRRRRKPRIKILRRDAVVIMAGGERRCPACTVAIKEGESVARCTANPDHMIHQRCMELVGGTCPMCKSKIK